MPSRIPRQWLLPLLIGAALGLGFGALRAAFYVPLGDGLDGAYYYQVARQVALGRGLTTTYSVFHMGLSPLPQPSTTYPLLPLLIGWWGRVVPLELAAVWVPGVSYVLSVVLCFAFLLWQTAHSLPRSSRFVRLALSTLLSVWLGLIPDYVWASARPYTDTLGTLLVFLALSGFGLASLTSFRGPGTRAAAFFGVGVLAGLCYLARFQWLVVPVALVASRLVARDRGAWQGALWLALGAAPCLAWQAWRQFSLPHAELRALLDFAAYRQLPELPRFDYEMHFDTRWHWFVDKLHGVLISLDPRSDNSYLVQHGYLVWLVPLGVVLLCARQAVRSRAQGLRALTFSGLRDPRHAALLASALLGFLAVLPIHTVHSLRWRSWAFPWRQGLPITFLIIPAAIWLWSLDRLVLRALVTLALAASLVVCARKTDELIETPVPTGMTRSYAEVGAYLNRLAPTGGTLGMEHQGLGVFTEAPLYWLACWSPPALASTLVQRLPIERILLRPGELGCPSLAGIRSRLSRERSFVDHYPVTLYRIAR
ncbi:MAG: hypothetical protein ABI488_01410 [Polyangiaceae bacterium]